MSGYRVAFKDVYPDMTPVPLDGKGFKPAWFDAWFADDLDAARAAYDAFDGTAILYRSDETLGALGRQVIAEKAVDNLRALQSAAQSVNVVLQGDVVAEETFKVPNMTPQLSNCLWDVEQAVYSTNSAPLITDWTTFRTNFGRTYGGLPAVLPRPSARPRASRGQKTVTPTTPLTAQQTQVEQVLPASGTGLTMSEIVNKLNAKTPGLNMTVATVGPILQSLKPRIKETGRRFTRLTAAQRTAAASTTTPKRQRTAGKNTALPEQVFASIRANGNTANLAQIMTHMPPGTGPQYARISAESGVKNGRYMASGALKSAERTYTIVETAQQAA